MKIIVASAMEAGSHFAHAINTVKMAQGFARVGHDVTVLCWRSRQGKIASEQLSQSYGLTAPLRWVQLPHFFGKRWLFFLWCLPVLRRVKPDMVFARHYTLPWLSSKLGITTVAESHAHPDNRSPLFLRMVKATHHPAFALWVTISHRLADHYRSLGVPSEKLIVLPDAVDLSLFRRPSQLPPSPYSDRGPHVVYAGHLYDYKGIPTILETAAQLPDIQFHLVGGWSEDVARQQKRAQELGLANVTFHGLKPHAEMPPYMWHADVLLLPPSQHHPSAFWTSPVKLGEYLASGRPLVVTSIPAMCDWLTDEEVEFVEPDNAQAMAKGIMALLSDPDYAVRLGQAGQTKAQTFSFTYRAERILERIAL